MYGILFFVLLVSVSVVSGCRSNKLNESVLDMKAPVTPAVEKLENLPDSLEVGKTLRVDKNLGSNLESLLKAATTAGGQVDAQCKIECDHELGGITCGIGRQCYCGCPGGYAYCGCKN